MQMGNQLMQQNTPPPPVQQAQALAPRSTQVSANPMLSSVPGPEAMSPAAASMTSSPAGIAALPAINNQPMGSQMMTAGLGPNQQGAVNEYLRSQGMVGFA
jgi:hypothetical protein